MDSPEFSSCTSTSIGSRHLGTDPLRTAAAAARFCAATPPAADAPETESSGCGSGKCGQVCREAAAIVWTDTTFSAVPSTALSCFDSFSSAASITWGRQRNVREGPGQSEDPGGVGGGGGGGGGGNEESEGRRGGKLGSNPLHSP
jgi:hypothetical protein